MCVVVFWGVRSRHPRTSSVPSTPLVRRAPARVPHLDELAEDAEEPVLAVDRAPDAVAPGQVLLVLLITVRRRRRRVAVHAGARDPCRKPRRKREDAPESRTRPRLPAAPPAARLPSDPETCRSRGLSLDETTEGQLRHRKHTSVLPVLCLQRRRGREEREREEMILSPGGGGRGRGGRWRLDMGL